ncbi:MAG: D-aminoacyl-tRNA deacylase [Nitriliruptoraceae bacterium]
MRALVQRVSSAAVHSRETPDGEPVETGRIGPGLVAFVGVTHTDGRAQAEKLAGKLYRLRVFPDASGGLQLSCEQVGGSVLVVSQFTLYGDTRKGRRPSFVAAAGPEVAEPLIDHLVAELGSLGAPVATGRFRTHMEVSLVNDGPVTLLLEV